MFEGIKLTTTDEEQLNEWAPLFSFKTDAPLVKEFLHAKQKIIALFHGNQSGKTARVAWSYVLRVTGLHPIADKNVDYFRCEDEECVKFETIAVAGEESYDRGEFLYHKVAILTALKAGWTMEHGNAVKCPQCGGTSTLYYEPIRIFRFASESLPTATGDLGKKSVTTEGEISEEVQNTTYPEFKKWCPPSLIVTDLTSRVLTVRIHDLWGGPDMIIEWVGYGQAVQRTAGQQRKSIWCDEEAPPMFIEEQWPRLIAADGDMVFSMTAANRLTHMYDDYYERAEIYYRSERTAEYGELAEYEESGNPTGIACFQAATDDNPTLSTAVIDRIFENVDDDDALAIRRYGLFKAITGRIFKAWDHRKHFIDWEKYFPNMDFPPSTWTHARGIDYHPTVPWHYVGMALSPDNELFIYAESMDNPEYYTTDEIAEGYVEMHPHEMGEDGLKKYYKHVWDGVDPLMTQKQPNTKLSPMDDLNAYFLKAKRAGLCGTAYWRSWDTKSLRGREEIRKRLKNAKKVGEPFNNVIIQDGVRVVIPTMWVSNRCPGVAKHMKNWRLEEWVTRDSMATKDQKETPQQKWSHYVMPIEAVLKEQCFRVPRRRTMSDVHYERPKAADSYIRRQ